MKHAKLICYFLNTGKTIIGTSAVLEKISHIEVEDGRERKIEKKFMRLENAVIIPTSQISDSINIEGLRYNYKFNDSILDEYMNSERNGEKFIEPEKILKPYTVFVNPTKFDLRIKKKEQRDYKNYLKMKEAKNKKTFLPAFHNLIKGDLKDKKSIYSHFSLGD